MKSTDLKENDVSLLDLFNIIKPKLLHIVILSVIVSLLTFGFETYQESKQEPPLINYRSEVRFVINIDQLAKLPVNEKLNSINLIALGKSLGPTFVQVIKSNAVLDLVVNQVDDSVKAEELSSNLLVEQNPDSLIIRVEMVDSDKVYVEQIMNAITTTAPAVIEEKVKMGTIELMERPSVPEAIDAPVDGPSRNFIYAGVFAFTVSVLIVYFFYFFNNKFKSENEIENVLGVPVIGYVSKKRNSKRGNV